MPFKKIFIYCLLIPIFLINNQISICSTKHTNADAVKLFSAELFFRSELYFGTNRKEGIEISDEEWNKFLAESVTPRFPDGFTVLDGYGQFQNSSGTIIREKSKVLILLYPVKNRIIVNRKIEQLRTIYKKAFQQESVLRIDFRNSIRVSF